MRTIPDRIRHAISFELLGVLIVTPLAAWIFALPGKDMGIVAVGSASLATVWNYVYNLAFDHVMAAARGSTRKSPALRVAHAVLFEAGLLVVLMPLIAWYLDIDILTALVLDGGLAVFYVCYAFVFNWAYDRLFPLPEWQA